MNIGFDARKNATNIRDRGISFELAARFDFYSALIWQDMRKPYSKLRFAALGLLDGRVHSLVSTEAAKGIRIISFRKAKKREVNRYEQ